MAIRRCIAGALVVLCGCGARHATNPTEVQVYVPSRGATVSALVTVRPAAGEGHVVEVALGPLQVTVDVSAEGEVTRARVPAQHLEARLASAGHPVIAHRAAPA